MGRLLIISQVYPPDPAAVGQYLAEVAQGAADLGRPVTVLTAGEGYADPHIRYEPYEHVDGVEIVRLARSSFGKGTLTARIAGAASFLGQAVLRGVRLDEVDEVLVSTSPPMAAAAALALSEWRGVPFTYWVMDVNPDQAVAMGHFDVRDWRVRAFDRFNRIVLQRADRVIALDDFMAERLLAKAPGRYIEVIPPWPLDAHLETIDHDVNPFRERHGLDGKFVVMFSGNMSPTSPIDVIVQAAYALRDDPDLVFAFIGAGAGADMLAERLDADPLENVLTLPYQPLSSIKFSLSAADVHCVTFGAAMVGITHPCKIYSALRIGRPVLGVAPRHSHVGDLLGEWVVEPGDVTGFIEKIGALRRGARVAPADLPSASSGVARVLARH